MIIKKRYVYQMSERKLIDVPYKLKTSVSDPDPHGSALRWPPWIRIRIRDADFGSGSGSYKITKKFKNIEYFCQIFL